MKTLTRPSLNTVAIALMGMGLVLAAPAAQADDGDAITPYRPSVSSPAQLPATGQLEMELGGLHQSTPGAQRNSLPYQFKLAFSKEWGLLLGGEATVASRDTSGNAQGVGDTSLVLKRAWTLDDSTAAGMEFGVKLPTANDTLGSGKADYTLNTIFSKDLGAVHMDANLNATWLGANDPGTSRTQVGLSASFSTALSERWGITGELSGTHRGGVANTAQLLGALTYSPSKRLTFDLGFARAFQPTPGTTSFFAGVVFPVAKFF
jgi:hypothetical protein